MDLLIAYVVAPAVLVGLAGGAGLLLAPLASRGALGSLIVPLGMALVVVVGSVTTFTGVTAAWTTPVVCALSLVGFGTFALRRWRGGGVRHEQSRDRDWWPLAVGVGAFAFYAAPVAMSGRPTWAGWLKLDDTASWLGFTDWLMTEGKVLPAEMSSTFERLVDVNFRGTGAAPYPTGAFPPLGIMSELTGTDPAWLIHPYMSVLGALLALGIYRIMRGLVRTRWIRATAAVIAAQAATVFGYVLWGGLKEILLPVLLVVLVVVSAEAARAGARLRTAVLPVVAAVAFLSVSGASGIGYVAPVLVTAALIGWIARRPRSGAVAAAAVGSGFAAGFVLLIAGLVPSRLSPVPEIPDIGNLVQPLNPWQAVGIWVGADFRVPPELPLVTTVLVAVCVVLAVAGFMSATAARDWPLPLYVGTTILVVAYSQFSGGAWLAGKAMAVASPGVIMAAMVGAAALARRWPGTRVVWTVAAASVGVGVLWSNGLAYRAVWLAPVDIQAELEQIGRDFTGQGPALMTDFSTFGGRHFLRGLDTEVAAELRVNPIPLRDGSIGQKGQSFDVVAFPDSTLAEYPLLVLRRSPSGTRPPLHYDLVRSGRFYDVWRRAADAPVIESDVPLAGPFAVAADEACAAIEALAEEAPEGGLLAAGMRREVISIPLGEGVLPEGWAPAGATASSVVPDGPGQVTGSFEVPIAGEYEVWLAGSFPGDVTIVVDGAAVLSTGGVIEADGSGASALGSVALGAGQHEVVLEYGVPWWRPGVTAGPFPMGPILLTPLPRDDDVITVERGRADELCATPVDWVAVAPGER